MVNVFIKLKPFNNMKKYFPSSELIINEDGSVFHLHVKPEWLADKVILTGFVQGKELDELYSNCYIYCLPSDVEGMPISLLEAMSYGKNCVVSNIEENTQVVENMATTFEKSNSEDLTKKLIDVLEGKNRKTEKELQDYILNKYNWDEITNITQKLYYRIIGKG